MGAPHGHPDRAGAQAHLLDRGRVVVAEHGRELALEGARLGDRVRRHAGQVGQDGALHVRRRVGQQHLPDPGGMHRQPAADGADDRHRRAAAQPVDVEHLGALAHGQVHRRERGAVEVVEVRRGELDEPGLVRGQQPEVPEPTTDHVVTRRRAGQGSPLDQLAHQSVCGRDRQPRPGGELGERQSAVLLVEGADQRQRPAGHRGAGGGHVPSHPRSLPLTLPLAGTLRSGPAP